MGVATGRSHTVTAVTTIPTQPRIVVPTTVVMAIIIKRLTMTLPQELTDGNRLLMGRTARPLGGPVTIRTPEPTLEALRSRLLMGVEVRHRPTILTPAPMLRPGKVRVRRLSGAAPTCREVTRALPWGITQLPMEQWQAPLIRREEKWPLLARSGGTVRLVKLRAAICTPGTMVMCIRTPAMDGKSTTMEAGTP